MLELTRSEDGRFCVVTPWYEHGSLAGWIDGGTTEWAEAFELGCGAAYTAALAHDRGIVHGRLHPSNLLVGPDGRLVIADYGLATVLGAGGSVEHEAYAAPEILAGERATSRSDVYALTAVLWALIAGDAPDAPGATLPGDLPAGVLALLERGLAEDPAALARYSESLAPLVTAAAPFLGHRPDDPQRLIARLGDLESLLLARLGAAPPVPRASSIPHAASSTWAQGKGEDARPHEV